MPYFKDVLDVFGRGTRSLRAQRVVADPPSQLGYALDDEEHAVGLRCVAAAIFDENGQALAAISLSGPKARIVDSRLSELGHAVRQTADEITQALGGSRPD